MFLGKLTPAIEGQALTDPKEEYRIARKIGPFRLTEQALFQPNGTYLLRSSILEAVSGWGKAHVTGCCAGGVPVARVLVTTQDKKFQLFCDNEATAVRLAAALNGTE